MSKLVDYFDQLTLGRLLILLSGFSLIFAFVLIFFMAEMVRDRAVRELASDEAKQTSKLVFQSLYSAMRKGWSKSEINEAIERLNTSLPGTNIKVYRGAVVAQQFGEISGERELIEKDPVLNRALANGASEQLFGSAGEQHTELEKDSPISLAMIAGQDMLLFSDKATIRYLYPVLAEQECLSCHTQSYVGAVQGVVDVSFPISKLKISFNYVLNTIIGYTLVVLGVVFFALYYKLRRMVVMPIANLVAVMRKITSEMDLNHRVSGTKRIVELRQLSEYFNQLLSTVQEYNTQLEELSIRDPLTGLYNRRKFEEFLRFEIIRAIRHKHAFSVIMIDLDNFKHINDTFGHPIGDIVLKELAALLAAELRKCDALARMGGDEFAIILPETGAANGLQVASKLHRALAGKEFELPIGKIRATASFSLVSFPEDGQTEEEIHAAMDMVLFKAKTHGKNQVMTTGSEEDRSMTTILRQGDFLRSALREDRIEAFLQPIVNVQTGDVIAYEVLVRIRDGEVIVPAGEFIEVAEELGMAQELDREIFRKGLMHYAGIARKHPQAKMFFNLFPRSFNDLDWVRGIPELVRNAGVPCENIVLEITEREALPNLIQVRALIEELRISRISVALDDFGSGFSSFLYLKYLEIDYVKIEGSFVRQITIDKRDRIMVEHINSMAHQFGLKTVAEFVEDAATAEMLAEIGVDYAQGYYYGRPARAE